MVSIQYLDAIIKGLGSDWELRHENMYAFLTNNKLEVSFSVSTLSGNSNMARFASGKHNPAVSFPLLNRCTEIGHPHYESFPAFNLTISRGADVAVKAILKAMPEVERLAKMVADEQEKENIRLAALKIRTDELVELSKGKLKLKKDSGHAFEVREINGLDRLEVYTSSTLVGMGYTSIPDWKAKRIIEILMMTEPE